MPLGELIIQIVLPLTGVLVGGGGLVSWWQARAMLHTARSESAKLQAEADQIRAETAHLVRKSELDGYARLVEALQADNEKLRAAFAEMRDQYRQQIGEIETRHAQELADMEARYRADVAKRDAQIAEIEARHDREIRAVRAGVLVLIGQLRELGVAPDWEPEWAADDNHHGGAD